MVRAVGGGGTPCLGRLTCLLLALALQTWHADAFLSLPPAIPVSRNHINNQLSTIRPTYQLKLSATSSSTADRELVDVVIIGAGIGGLTCGALLAKYGLKVVVCESHSLAGGCAHSFEREGFLFDSGPSIFSGMSREPYNPLQQILNLLGEAIPLITYNGWGNLTPSGFFKFECGATNFRDQVVRKLGGDSAATEFDLLLQECQPLMDASSAIPPFALRADAWIALTMLPYLPQLLKVAPLADELNGPFTDVMDKVPITSPFLRNWLDFLAFALSGLPADGTVCAAMAYTLSDLHRDGAVLDYPKGGGGAIIDALVRGLKKYGGELRLRTHVEEVVVEGGRAVGIRLKDGHIIQAGRGVVSNAAVWDTMKLLPEGSIPDEYRKEAMSAPYTMSFFHLHIGIEGSQLPPGTLPHYTVINDWEQTLGEQNMIAVSIPTVLDPSLAPDGCHIIHAYGAANEPWEKWENMDRRSPEYQKFKEERAEALWRAIERIVPDARQRVKVKLEGSPLTHKRFLRRSFGTYGPAYPPGEKVFPSPADIPLPGLLCCGDSIFPGIGVPAVAVSGANAANTLVPAWKQLLTFRT